MESNGIMRRYEYHHAGLVRSMTVELNGLNIKIILSRDDKGLLNRSEWSGDGAPYQTEVYSFENGKITKVDVFLAGEIPWPSLPSTMLATMSKAEFQLSKSNTKTRISHQMKGCIYMSIIPLVCLLPICNLTARRCRSVK